MSVPMGGRESIPETKRREMRRHQRFNSVVILTGLGAMAVTMLLAPMVYDTIVRLPARYMPGTTEFLWSQLRILAANPANFLILGAQGELPGLDALGFYGSLVGFLIVGATATGAVVGTNPYRSHAMIHGDARWATKRDVMALDKGKLSQFGPSGTFLHFGYHLASGIRIAMKETLSVLVMAPPGTGKTAGFAVPSILTSDTSSMIVHDCKPELWDLTSGYRATKGEAFRLDWSKTDDPDKGEWHPCFNYLDPGLVPPPGDPNRDTMIDALCKILIPDAKGGEGGADEYFRVRGRAVLTGLIHFLVAKVNDRRLIDPNDPLAYAMMPKRWEGYDASLPMLVQWVSELMMGVNQEGGADADPNADPWKDAMRDVVAEARDGNYPQRCVLELQPMIEIAPNERSGILGMVDKAFVPFKNAAVVERTAKSDFLPCDMHGRLTPKALKRLGCAKYPRSRQDWDRIVDDIRPDEDWAPVSVYICINQAMAPAFETITSLFFEMMSNELLAHSPNTRNSQGALMGPYATCLMMDEFAKMAKCQSVLSGPDLGRSKKTYYCLIAQNLGQISRIYSQQDREVIMATTAVKVVFNQMDEQSVQTFTKLVGETTVHRVQHNRNVGFFGEALFKKSRSDTLEKTMLLDNSDLMNMEMGTHILILQGSPTQPIRCRTPMYFLEEEMRARTWNEKAQQGIPPATPLPEAIWAARRTEYEAEAVKAKQVRDQWVELHTIDIERFTQTPALSP